MFKNVINLPFLIFHHYKHSFYIDMVKTVKLAYFASWTFASPSDEHVQRHLALYVSRYHHPPLGPQLFHAFHT